MARNHRSRFLLLAALVLQLLGCAGTDGRYDKTIAGGALGATAGALAGYYAGGHSNRERVANAVLGAVAGAAVGGIIGHYLDAQDQRNIQNSLNQVPPYNTVVWTNPNTGNVVQVTPAAVQPGPRPCRSYTTEVYTPDGRRIQQRKTACRDAYGNWNDIDS